MSSQKIMLRSCFGLPSAIAALLVSSALIVSGCGESDTPQPQAEQTGSSSTPDGTATEGSDDVSAKTDELVDAAVQLIGQQKFGEALQKLNQALELDRNCAEACFQRAGILADTRKYDRQALNDYSRAVELKPNETRYHNMRGLFLLTRQQYDGAESDFTAALQSDPKYVQAWNNRGLVRLARGDYEAAIEDFSKAVEIDPTYADGFNNRGFAWFQAAVDANALRDFNRTIELKPDFVNAWNNRGMLYMKLRKYQAAADDFSEAIRLDDANIKHYQNRRLAYQQMGLTAQAEADADRIQWLLRLRQINVALSRDPSQPDAYIERANHFAEGGRHDVALASFEQAINVAPDRSKGWVSRARYWLQQGEPEKAIEDATRAIAVSQASDAEFSHTAFSIRGDACFQLGRFDEAIADYTRAKRIDPQVAQAYLKRAELRKRQGDSAGAQADIQQALALDPDAGASR